MPYATIWIEESPQKTFIMKTSSWRDGKEDILDKVPTYTRKKTVRETDMEFLADVKKRIAASGKERKTILADGMLIETTDAEKWERYGKVRDRH